MSALPILIITLCVLALAYRYYGAFLVAKVVALDDRVATPAHKLNDGHNYYPTGKWVLFGHHFAAIAGAGPLIGPVLAAQFGFLPGFLWILIGVVLAGAVQDLIVLTASVRHNGKSLAEIATSEIGRPAGIACAVAVLFIIIVALAGLGFVVVNALAESAWGTFTIAASIPIALLMGWYAYRLRGGASTAVRAATIFGVAALIAAVVAGRFIPGIPFLNRLFLLDRSQIIIAMAIYGFVASVLPVWLLLCPRDYLSSYMKVGTVLLLIVGVAIVNPKLQFPAVTSFIHGGGPIIHGKVWPFLFITIMCGAISGFHALVSSGTTPKMLDRQSHIRPIGMGCMLLEGLVAVVCLIAVCALHPGDYYAINAPGDVFRQLGIAQVNLPQLTAQVGEANLCGRTGGAVTLAVGMAQIFSALPGLKGLMSYWYHFAIMFEALFILTTIDAGTRIARFLIQEFAGKVYKPFGRTDWMPGTVLASLAVVGAWAYLIWNASISTIWPMFGVANQLLAAVALCVGTMFLVNTGRARYAWVTAVPMGFVTVTSLLAAGEMVKRSYWPSTASSMVVVINMVLILVMVACAFVVLWNAFHTWRHAPRRVGRPEPCAVQGTGGGIGVPVETELQAEITEPSGRFKMSSMAHPERSEGSRDPSGLRPSG